MAADVCVECKDLQKIAAIRVVAALLLDFANGVLPSALSEQLLRFWLCSPLTSNFKLAHYLVQAARRPTRPKREPEVSFAP